MKTCSSPLLKNTELQVSGVWSRTIPFMKSAFNCETLTFKQGLIIFSLNVFKNATVLSSLDFKLLLDDSPEI